MQEIKCFQVRGVPGEVVRAQFGPRIVDYWIPKGGTDRLLIAHDGQNIFDGKTSTHRGHALLVQCNSFIGSEASQQAYFRLVRPQIY